MHGWLFIFASAWCLPLMPALAVADVQGGGCSAKRCGNLTISDPFWLTDIETGRSCGDPDFEVTCFNDSSPVLRSSTPFSFGFAIINISYEEDRLHVVDEGKMQILLPTADSCQVPMLNTSAKLGRRLRVNHGSLKLILYNCTEAAVAAATHEHRELLQTTAQCGKDMKVLVHAGGRYYESSDYGSYVGCDTIIVPVVGSSAEVNASDYERLISDGFLMTWDEPLPPPLAYCQIK